MQSDTTQFKPAAGGQRPAALAKLWCGKDQAPSPWRTAAKAGKPAKGAGKPRGPLAAATRTALHPPCRKS